MHGEAGSDGAGRRRRRRRATRAQGAPAAAPEAADAPATPARPADPAVSKPRKKRPPRDSSVERSLRDIVGAGRSQVGVSGALRARDVNRPTDADLAAAESDVVIVRRNWQPPGAKP